MNYNVLIIDDEEQICYSLKRVLENEQDLQVEFTTSGEDGISKYKKNRYDIVITDLVMPDINGIEIIEAIKDIDEDAMIIMITGKGSEEIAASAIKKGAYDYFSKPFNFSQFFKTVRNAKEKIKLKKELQEKNKFYSLSFISKKMNNIVESIKKAAKTEFPILIMGESGTGKELIAESIYKESIRNSGNFIKINCGAIPENLIESELFGYEKGAYTGAVNSKKGKLELADNGTVFLDEIGELDIKSQVKLLRILEDGILEKIGAEKSKKINIRIIAATNKDLEEEVKQGKFRLDLFYRLNTFHIYVPSLRERKEDILYLANIFLNEFSKNYSNINKEFSTKLKQKLLEYSWPGNVRQLKNIVQNMVVMGSDKIVLDVDDMPKMMEIKSDNEIYDEMPLKDYIKVKEKQYLIRIISKYQKNKTEAAKILGISRKTLYEKLNEHDIEY